MYCLSHWDHLAQTSVSAINYKILTEWLWSLKSTVLKGVTSFTALFKAVSVILNSPKISIATKRCCQSDLSFFFWIPHIHSISTHKPLQILSRLYMEICSFSCLAWEQKHISKLSRICEWWPLQTFIITDKHKSTTQVDFTEPSFLSENRGLGIGHSLGLIPRKVTGRKQRTLKLQKFGTIFFSLVII